MINIIKGFFQISVNYIYFCHLFRSLFHFFQINNKLNNRRSFLVKIILIHAKIRFQMLVRCNKNLPLKFFGYNTKRNWPVLFYARFDAFLLIWSHVRLLPHLRISCGSLHFDNLTHGFLIRSLFVLEKNAFRNS